MVFLMMMMMMMMIVFVLINSNKMHEVQLARMQTRCFPSDFTDIYYDRAFI